METNETEQQAHDRKMAEIVSRIHQIVEERTIKHQRMWRAIIIVQVVLGSITLYRAWQFERIIQLVSDYVQK